MNNRDEILLLKIIQYVDEITITVERYELDYDKFVADFVVRMLSKQCETLQHITMERSTQRF